jgi:hypothetical protein
MHPTDVFVKNTHEVLGPLHELTAYHRLIAFEYLTEDRNVRRATYGEGSQAVNVTVNFGPTSAEVNSETGGRVVLPPWGFLVEAPRFIAFHARSWNGQDTAMEPLHLRKRTTRTERLRHCVFSAQTLAWRKTYEVRREEVISPAPPKPARVSAMADRCGRCSADMMDVDKQRRQSIRRADYRVVHSLSRQLRPAWSSLAAAAGNPSASAAGGAARAAFSGRARHKQRGLQACPRSIQNIHGRKCGGSIARSGCPGELIIYCWPAHPRVDFSS